MRALALVSLLILGACSSDHELAVAKGPVFALNTTRWKASPLDLTLINSTAGQVPAAAPAPIAPPPSPVMLAPAQGASRS